ncbi:hypothetical protein DTO96_102147 [Ephemeroptericola cinctiostellae]|uniref:Phage baseplate assembly protein V n=1 Tax=Ephemeroptericola cinctiostellae TaxID=2268024 RepID=A0A345DDF5_9BURK|nr:phage baseplate assembly protein [Ephemeroptericola cinctiostellae]AXF86393.1 hypothetical protein DTO96_102147 [Ephemeroptericola cinctiostellae]
MALSELIRKAKMVFTSVALVQKYKISVFETKDAEESERFQDYGFAAQPSEGEGLVIDAGGVQMVLRIDRLKDRPKLSADDVAVWHKEGHSIWLKAGKIIDVDCAVLNIKASTSVNFTTPKITNSGEYSGAGDVVSAAQVSDSAGSMQSMRDTHNEHDHNETDNVTGKPNQPM